MSGALSSNPMLLNPENRSNQVVQPLVAMTAPAPVELLPDDVQSCYYHCTVLNHHMHRFDGKRLAFTFGILETRDMADIQYLNSEIAGNNPFIRKASPEEVHTYKMRIDPRGTIERELSPELEAKLSAELRAAIEAKMNIIGLSPEQQVALLDAVPMKSLSTTDSDKIAGVDSPVPDTAAIPMQGGVATLLGSMQRSIVGSDRTVNAIVEKKS